MGVGSTLLALTCAALEDKIKSNCSSYPFQCVQTYTFFALMECWVFSSRNLVFNKGSLVLEWLFKSASWREIKRSWSWSWFMDQSQFRVQSQDWGLPITWCTGGKDSFWVTWRMVLDPTVPTKAFLLVDGHQNICCRGGMKMRDVL